MLLEKVAGAKWLSQFYLAGGTSLALQLGHRLSIDFDFFTDKTFSTQKIIQHLSKVGKVSIQDESTGTLNLFLDQIKLSFLLYPYPLIHSTHDFNQAKLASIDDIAAMKLIAIAQRGTKKDFIDMWILLKNGWNLTLIFETLEKKFSKTKYNKAHLLKSLAYFEDAEGDAEPQMLIPFSWEAAKEDLLKAALKL